MPLYEYECEACHHLFERRQHFHEEQVAMCPACQGKAKRVFHSVPVFFKGSGWYVNDYGGRGGSSPSSSSEKPASDKPAKPESKAAAKSEPVKSSSPPKESGKSS